MRKALSAPWILSLAAAALLSACASGTGEPRLVSEQTVRGFAFPESVACDAAGRVLYVSQFGGDTLQPTARDGQGRISRLSADGQVLEAQFLPAPGGAPLNKPKGVWVQGERLWVTDIDAVWVFDLKTREGRKVVLPDARFANDVTVQGGALYVSDNRSDRLYRVEPADFLHQAGEPAVTLVIAGTSVNPNGLYPARDGTLLAVGFASSQQWRGIYAISATGQVAHLSENIGRLDGVAELDDGSILATDWNSGALIRWRKHGRVHQLTGGFKGPADFCVLPDEDGYTVVVPDLVQSELRFIRLER